MSTIAAWGARAFSSLINSRPVMRGIFRSVSTSQGRNRPTRSRASAPSTAPCAAYPRRRTDSISAVLMDGSSSTIKIRSSESELSDALTSGSRSLMNSLLRQHRLAGPGVSLFMFFIRQGQFAARADRGHRMRQYDRKRGAMACYAVDIDAPMVRLDNRMHDGKAESGTLVFRRKKWI